MDLGFCNILASCARKFTKNSIFNTGFCQRLESEIKRGYFFYELKHYAQTTPINYDQQHPQFYLLNGLEKRGHNRFS